MTLFTPTVIGIYSSCCKIRIEAAMRPWTEITNAFFHGCFVGFDCISIHPGVWETWFILLQTAFVPLQWVQTEVLYSLKYNKCHDALVWFSIVCGPVHLLPSFDCVSQDFWTGLLEENWIDHFLLKSLLGWLVQ